VTSFFFFSIETENLAKVATEDCLLGLSGDVHGIDVIRFAYSNALSTTMLICPI
jgi:hypothetical protein